ncbi:MBL fold metallo-hydrolase [Leucobacter muris]|uniref:MBL fold metallo-hydrolase n=1 Tax=Leucobacter muris TaxID=1935379 RepID=UPI001E51643B|nr:MBL fold metallo-hydrolase [Leucobacter muris]
MKLSTHLYRVGNDIVAAYLVVTPEGVTIIDAGLSGHWRDLRAELTVAGRTLGDVKGIILTHGDSDHLGFAERLRRHLGIPVYVHHADAARAMGGPKPPNAKQQMRFLPLVEFLTYALRKGGLRTSWLTRTIDVRDGEVLDLPGSPPPPHHRPSRALRGQHRRACSARRRSVRRRWTHDTQRPDRRDRPPARAVHR